MWLGIIFDDVDSWWWWFQTANPDMHIHFALSFYESHISIYAKKQLEIELPYGSFDTK